MAKTTRASKVVSIKNLLLIGLLILLPLIGFYFGRISQNNQVDHESTKSTSNITPTVDPAYEYFNNPQRIAKFFYTDYKQFMTGQKIKSTIQNPTTYYLSNSIFTNNKLKSLTTEEIVCSTELPSEIVIDDNPPSIIHGVANLTVNLRFPDNSQKQTNVTLAYDESEFRWKINSIQCI